MPVPVGGDGKCVCVLLLAVWIFSVCEMAVRGGGVLDGR